MPRRRPELYHPLAASVPSLVPHPGGRSLVAVLSTTAGSPDAVAVAVADAARGGADVVVLPACAAGPHAAPAAPAPAAEQTDPLLAELGAALAGTHAVAVTSVVEVTQAGPSVAGTVVAAGGPVLHQPVLHTPDGANWVTVLGDRQKVLAREVDGATAELALLAGDDALVPEAARLALLAGAEVLALPWDGLADPARRAVVVARAVENGLTVLAAARDGVLAVGPDGRDLGAQPGHAVTVPVGRVG